MAGFDAEGLDREFLTGTGWRSLLVVNVGTPGPQPWFQRPSRLDYEDVVRHL